MFGPGKGFLPNPGHAFATHLREGVGVAIHPDGHVMAANAGHGTRAFGHPGRGIVRTARAEPGFAFHHHRQALVFFFFGLYHGNARLDASMNGFGQGVFCKAFGNRFGNNGWRQFMIGRQQPFATRHRPLTTTVIAGIKFAIHIGAHVIAPVIQLFFQGIFQNLAFFFHHQDFIKSLGKIACPMCFKGPYAAYFVQADANGGTGFFIQSQVKQGLTHVKIGFAGCHNAKAGIG